MKTIDFIRQRRFYGKGEKFAPVRRHMITKDGTEISIQRGRGVRTTPPIPYLEKQHVDEHDCDISIMYNYDKSYYEVVYTVEVGLYGNQALTRDSELIAYCEDPYEYFDDEPNTDMLYVFNYVPLDVVDRFIEEHGGYHHTDGQPFLVLEDYR